MGRHWMGRRWLTLAIVLGVLILGTALYYFIAPWLLKREEPRGLEDTWKVVSLKDGGVDGTPDEEELIYVFQGGRLLMRSITRKEETADVNTYQVDDTKDPKAIDMTI